MGNKLLERLGIEHPIIQAPMAGGPSTPELVAAVSNAGGLGSLGAAYITPEQISDAAGQIRKLTNRPFNVNLFAGGYVEKIDADAGPMLALLSEIHTALELTEPVLPKLPPDPFEAQFEAAMEIRPTVFSFTFGIPNSEAMSRLKAAGVFSIGTATTVEEAQLLERAGVDAVALQGAEAGAHRGTFAGPFENSMVPTMQFVRDAVKIVRVPVIASGGIMDGREIAAALALGAEAVQLGTAFLACPESGAAEAYKQAVLGAKTDRTTITRAFSGRSARGIANEFMQKLAGREDMILPYPLQNALTRTMRAAAAKRGDTRYLSLWAGQGVARARSMPAGELVRRLVQEIGEAQAAA